MVSDGETTALGGQFGVRKLASRLIEQATLVLIARRIMSDDQLAGTGLKSAAGCLESSGMMPCGSLLSHFLKICRLVIEQVDALHQVESSGKGAVSLQYA